MSRSKSLHSKSNSLDEKDHLEELHKADSCKVVVVESVTLTAAKEHGLNLWSKDSFILYLCCFTSFLCSCANGYDGSLMTTINIMPFYQNRFNAGIVGSTTGIIFSVYTIGGLASPWIAGPITDRFGRRGGMFIGSIVICIGSAVIASANDKGQLIAGRFILGFGVSILTCAAPAYIVEISPPQWRGRMTGLYNCGWFGGSIPAAAITLGTQKINSDLSWRLPLIFQCAPAFFVIFIVWFLPESPRWLLANSRDEEARAFLNRFHGGGDPRHPVVELEWHEFKESITTDGADKRWYDYSELFRSKSARWRFLMVVFMAIFGQFSGNGLGYFNTQIYSAVGYSNYAQFVLNLCSSIVSCIGALCGVVLSDRVPRRKVLVSGTLASAFFLAINGGLSAKWAHLPEDAKDLKVGQGAVAAYFFFNIVYSFAYTPLQAIYPVECLSTNGRAKGMAMYGVVVNLFGFINMFAGPIALNNIQYNYVFIFVGWDCIEGALWYFFAVETVGRTLEELEEVFTSSYPPRAKTKKVVTIKENGQIELTHDA
ncbi:general substrate transporter [Phellopilus nigrolimitatus]|nr:general substrate transporter [Phellopilus nigrolimitatus]